MRSGSLWRVEVRQLLTGRAWLGLVLILSLLVGSTFAQAVSLFSEGSRAASTSPDLARGLNPFDGILVPAFGSAYLVATLLLPFVAIRQISVERESGALKLVLGLGCDPSGLVLRKAVVLSGLWFCCLLVPLGAAGAWASAGGHVGRTETAGLLLGHLLYGLVVISLSLLAGSLGRSSATASLLVIAATLGSWVLDFEGAAGSGWLARLSPMSLTQVLRPLERGLLSPAHLIPWLLLVGVVLGLAAFWLHPGRPLGRKVAGSFLAAVVLLTSFLVGTRWHGSMDLTEDRRHSFPPAVEQALNRVQGPLEVEARLDSEDPRWMDLERGLLRKLQRAVPHIRVSRTVPVTPFGREGLGSDGHYGEVVYRYQGKESMSRSTSEEEVLPLLWSLTSTEAPHEDSGQSYPGYPLVLVSPPGFLWFRVVLPLLAIALWIFHRRPRTLLS